MAWNTALDDDVGRAADHDQVLDLIAANKHKAPACIDCGCIQNLQAWLPVAAAANERRRAAASSQHPKNSDQADKADADAEDGNHQPAAIGAHHFFDHPWISFSQPW
jgi:hypothetical protein